MPCPRPARLGRGMASQEGEGIMAVINHAQAPNEESQAVTGTALRHALGHFATGITVISTRDAAGKPYGATVSSFSSLSLDPPLIQWSLTTKSYSYPIFREATHFAVNILASDQEEVSRTFCKPLDRLAHVQSLEG